MKFKRIFAIVMAITILCSLSIGVSAATVPDATIDFTKTGSIDIYKYDLTMANTDDSVAALLESYVSTGVKDAALEAAMDNGTVNDLGNGQQSYGYTIKGVEFSYLKVADIVTYSETEADGVHRDMVLYKFDDAKDAALLSALGLSDADAPSPLPWPPTPPPSKTPWSSTWRIRMLPSLPKPTSTAIPQLTIWTWASTWWWKPRFPRWSLPPAIPSSSPCP